MKGRYILQTDGSRGNWWLIGCQLGASGGNWWQLEASGGIWCHLVPPALDKKQVLVTCCHLQVRADRLVKVPAPAGRPPMPPMHSDNGKRLVNCFTIQSFTSQCSPPTPLPVSWCGYKLEPTHCRPTYLVPTNGKKKWTACRLACANK